MLCDFFSFLRPYQKRNNNFRISDVFFGMSSLEMVPAPWESQHPFIEGSKAKFRSTCGARGELSPFFAREKTGAEKR